MDEQENKIKTFARLCRAAVPEGIVLLESDGALPLKEGENVALFGRGQFEYVKSGTGSGGRVNCDYVTNIFDELKKRVSLDGETLEFYREYVKENPFDAGNGWRALPSQKQSVPSEDLVKRAAARCEKAIFVLCRACGESYDSEAVKGDWFLSEEEEATIALLSKTFRRLIVLINGGNLIDLNWIKKYSVGTAAFVWQGGQEGGAGTVDALLGDVPPSGRLADTAARDLAAYPSSKNFGDTEENVHVEDIYVGYRYFETFDKDAVLYPFGYGLSYTRFEQTVKAAEKSGDSISLCVSVKNVGEYSGKDVVEVYFEYPKTALGAPDRQLIAFKKTELLKAGEETEILLTIDEKDMAAYDDCGLSGEKYCYVLEAGEYGVYVGKNVRDAQKAFSFEEKKLRVVKRCKQALAPEKAFDRLTRAGYSPAPTAEFDLAKRVREALPKEIEVTGDRGIVLQDVASGKATMDEFVAQFDEKALFKIVRGEGMSSPKAPVPGTASCFAGTNKTWRNKGVPVVTTCDGPSGVRMESSARATCIPTGSLIASSWSPEAYDGIFDCFAEELAGYDVDVILAPGVNIHRHPLCGRNFEYYSEDPYLAGQFAAKVAEKFTNRGVYATLKHFAVNSQETNRAAENEVLSERAAREIYLKVFEIAVKSGYVRAIMTSYNRINGVSAASNYDLLATILRGEWGYDGLVMTDWWTLVDDAERKTHTTNNLAEMVRATNDVYMVTPDSETYQDNQAEAFSAGRLTMGELQFCAKNILRFALQTLAFRSGRTGDFEDLSAYDELLFKDDLTKKEFRDAVNEDTYVYHGMRLKDVQTALPKEGFYCAEITYAIDGDVLEQHSVGFSVDKKEPTRLVLGGTAGKASTTRFKLYLKQDSTLSFPDECVKEFAVYRLK